LEAASSVIKSLVGECEPITVPTPEAHAAMEQANACEEAGDIAGAKEWIARAVELGHSCLAEHGGWK